MTESDIAYLLFVMLFVVFIAISYFASSRGMFGSSLKQMGVWCLIFFGFLSIFGMRDTLSEQLFPEEPEQILAQGSSYVFQRDEDGHFYATLRINDVPIRLVVDTGATGLVLTKDDAKHVGIPMERLVYSQWFCMMCAWAIRFIPACPPP